MTQRTAVGIPVILAFFLSGQMFGQASPEKVSIPLTDPNRPVFLKVGLISGSILVKGGAGKEVIVEARSSMEDEDEPKEKRSGSMKRIPNTSMGLTAEEEDNTVTVGTGMRGVSRKIDLIIQVPAKCSMTLSTVNGGDIDVESVTGDLEINNTNGSITVKQIAGSVVAQTVNGEVHVTFTKVNTDKAMSFSSFNGDIDVTFPAAAKLSVQLKSEQGEIFSDFDVRHANHRGQGRGKWKRQGEIPGHRREGDAGDDQRRGAGHSVQQF